MIIFFKISKLYRFENVRKSKLFYIENFDLQDITTPGCDDLDFMKNTLVVKKENDSYVVSFNYLTWPDNKTMCESVIVYVNSDGKISHTKRPSDGYMIPEE